MLNVNTKSQVSNQKGFGLIETMVAVAIGSIVMAGIMQSTYISGLQTNMSDAKNSVASVTGFLSQIAVNPVSCTLAVTVHPQQYGQNIRFDLPDGTAITPNSALTNYGLTVNSFTYTGANVVQTGSDGTKIYFGTLNLSLMTKKQVLGPNTFAPRGVSSVYMLVDPTGKIVSCGGVLPTLPAVTPPVTPPVVSVPVPTDLTIAKTCNQIGGVMNGSECQLPCGHDVNL